MSHRIRPPDPEQGQDGAASAPVRENQIVAEPATVEACRSEYAASSGVRSTAEKQWNRGRKRGGVA